MIYAKALESVINEATPAQGCTRAELEAGIAEISNRLRGPLGDAERILLCGERATLRKALQSIE